MLAAAAAQQVLDELDPGEFLVDLLAPLADIAAQHEGEFARLAISGAVLDETALAALEAETEAEIDRAIAFAEASPMPPAEEALHDVV